MDPISAISVASAVFQFVDFGVKVAKKWAQYVDTAHGDLPRWMESVGIQLPLLVNALSRLKTESQTGKYDDETRRILLGVVTGCMRLVRELDDIAEKIRPKQDEKLTTKLKKFAGSLRNEERIEQIDRGLQAHVQILILHQVVDKAEFPDQRGEEAQYFVVKEKLVADPVARDALLSQLDECFYAAARSQSQRPAYVVLSGQKGVGKSQLALKYCHNAYKLGQFRTVFWLDAKTPSSLQLSLDSVASEIQRTKKGTRSERLAFVKKFLTERWQPWLLVLDGYHEAAFASDPVTQILPVDGHGAILITTCNAEVKMPGTVIKVHKFLTAAEVRDLRYKVTDAINSKNLTFLHSAIDEGLEVNACGINIFGNEGASYINIAAERGFDEAVKLFLMHGASAHLEKHVGSALDYAVRSGKLSTVSLILDHEDKKCYRLEQDAYDITFRTTMENGYVDILRGLLERRGDLFSWEQPRVSEGFMLAAGAGHIDVLRHLLSINRLPDHSRTSADALSAAIKGRHLEVVKCLLYEVQVNPSVSDRYGQPPLYEAVAINHREGDAEIREKMVRLLLDAGAATDIGKLPNKRTPLHHAAMYGFVPIINLLLEHGADITVQDDEGKTPLLMAAEWKQPKSYPPLTTVKIEGPEKQEKYCTPALFFAAREGDRELLLQVSNHIDINTVDTKSGFTALLIAIKSNHTPIARMLIRKGARQDFTDRNNQTPLVLAAKQGLDLVVRDLAAAGLEATDDRGNTALVLAAQANREKVVKVLIELGADKNAMNDFGETALDIAEEKGYESIIRLLQSS